MTFELWQRVPLNTSMFAVDKLSLLVLVKDKEEILASVRGNSGQNNFVFYAPISKADHPIPYYSPQDNLGALMSEVAKSSDIEMIAIPPIQWGSEAFSLRNPANLKRLAAIVGGLALIVVVGVLMANGVIGGPGKPTVAPSPGPSRPPRCSRGTSGGRRGGPSGRPPRSASRRQTRPRP